LNLKPEQDWGIILLIQIMRKSYIL
jgi:hypothetical protein